jgi:ABC-type branched-subunit amino acid transport system ATPase component
VLSVQNLSSGSMVRNTSFSIYAGQIAAIFGLVGGGRTEMMKVVAGVIKRDLFYGGDVPLDGKQVRYRVPRNTGIASIVRNFDSSMMRLYRRLGCDVEVLGSTSTCGHPIYLGLHPISESAVRRIKKKLKGAQFAFAEARVVAA